MSSSLVLRAVAFVMVVPAAVAGWIPCVLFSGESPFGPRTVGRVLGATLFVVGWSILIRCTFEFVQRGRGTPSPSSAPTKLVVSGLFRFVRNPMYVGVITAIVGIGLARRSWGVIIYAASVAVAFHLRVTLYEEPRLTREFGADYRAYRERVPRWLPRLHTRP